MIDTLQALSNPSGEVLGVLSELADGYHSREDVEFESFLAVGKETKKVDQWCL
jgi:hypothetical protein